MIKRLGSIYSSDKKRIMDIGIDGETYVILSKYGKSGHKVEETLTLGDFLHQIRDLIEKDCN